MACYISDSVKIRLLEHPFYDIVATFNFYAEVSEAENGTDSPIATLDIIAEDDDMGLDASLVVTTTPSQEGGSDASTPTKQGENKQKGVLSWQGCGDQRDREVKPVR